MIGKNRVFIPLNHETAFDLFCRSTDEIINSGTVGSLRHQDDADLASEFVMAASLLIDATTDEGQPVKPWMCVHPILYLYRHAIELELKGLVRPHKLNHDLDSLVDALLSKVSDEHTCDISEGWFVGLIREFSALDKRSTGFRYVNDLGGDRIHQSEYEVDVKALKKKLEPLFHIFLMLRMGRRSPQSGSGVRHEAQQDAQPNRDKSAS